MSLLPGLPLLCPMSRGGKLRRWKLRRQVLAWALLTLHHQAGCEVTMACTLGSKTLSPDGCLPKICRNSTSLPLSRLKSGNRFKTLSLPCASWVGYLGTTAADCHVFPMVFWGLRGQGVNPTMRGWFVSVSSTFSPPYPQCSPTARPARRRVPGTTGAAPRTPSALTMPPVSAVTAGPPTMAMGGSACPKVCGVGGGDGDPVMG